MRGLPVLDAAIVALAIPSGLANGRPQGTIPASDEIMAAIGRDYTSFSAAAKTRFRGMAAELGYEQVTGVTYVKPREGWYELFYLQASSWGNPFFYFNYGAILPRRFPLNREELKSHGWLLGRRLDHPRGAFPCATKADIQESANFALQAYKRSAVPWFKSLNLTLLEKARTEAQPRAHGDA